MSLLNVTKTVLVALIAFFAGAETFKRFQGRILSGIEKRFGKHALLFLLVVLSLALVGVWLIEDRIAAETEAKRLDEKRQAEADAEAKSLKEKREAVEEEARKPTYVGTVKPANDPIGVPPDSLLLLMGSFSLRAPPSTVHVISCRSRDVITIGVEDGRAWVSAHVVDSTGKSIARVNRNDVISYQGRRFYTKKPDASTYVVNDFEGAEVLRLRFMNRRAIKLTGKFYLPGGGIVDIEPDGIHLPGGGYLVGNIGLTLVKPGAGAFELCGS